MDHLQYLMYCVRHKWYVFLECLHYRIPFAGVIHDWQKFTPTEWGPYVHTFYNPDGSKRSVRDATGDYDPTKLGERFDRAWLHHQHLGPHHWQHYILREDDGATKVLEMPLRYRKEMVADWIGAGRALGFYVKGDRLRETRGWYLKNKDKILLGEATRKWVEKELGVEQQ